MTILELLQKLTGGAQGLTELLMRVRTELPDLAPVADNWLALLGSAASQENLVELASVLPAEIANIIKGHIDPKDHPSDAI